MQVKSLQHFRQNVARLMEDRGLSYRELAEMAGMSYVFLHRVLTGKANPSIDVADKVADALDAQLSDLIADPSAKKFPVLS